ncbi:hypothetical protein [Agathobaculum sp. Marseille-P7918]
MNNGNTDLSTMLDELLILSKRDKLERYRKRLKYYGSAAAAVY